MKPLPHRYEKEVIGCDGSTTMDSMACLSPPSDIAPVKMTMPFSGGSLKYRSRDMMDSSALWTFVRVDFDLMFAAEPCSSRRYATTSEIRFSWGMYREIS